MSHKNIELFYQLSCLSIRVDHASMTGIVPLQYLWLLRKASAGQPT